MYNSKYGKLRYGIKQGATKVIKISGDLTEDVYSIAGIGDSTNIHCALSEMVTMSIKGYNTHLLDGTLLEETYSESKINTCYSIKEELQGDVFANARACKNIFLVFELADELKNDTYLSKNISLIESLADEISGSIFLGKKIFMESLFFDEVNADISANVLEKEIAYLDVLIPPGGEIRIDSSLFNATLNGNNILHLYSGDWINVSRDTTTLAIQTATGGTLSGKLLLTERYL